MILFCMAISTILSISLTCLTHPISMGAILMLQTIMVILTIGYFSINFWYSYILFLIMVSGMLVLFAYMTSVASNEKFQPSIKIFIMVIFMALFFTFIMMFMDQFYSNINSMFLDSIKENSNYPLSMSKYFNQPNSFYMIMLIIYLLITLIAIVKITKTNLGPLRQTH